MFVASDHDKRDMTNEQNIEEDFMLKITDDEIKQINYLTCHICISFFFVFSFSEFSSQASLAIDSYSLKCLIEKNDILLINHE